MIEVIPDFVTLEEEERILEPFAMVLNLGRGTQRNRIFNYGQMTLSAEALRLRARGRRLRSYRLDPDMESPFMPPCLWAVANRIHEAKLVAQPIVIATINEYLPGQRIQPHIDVEDAGPEIATLNLLSEADVVFTKKESAMWLSFQRFALMIFSGEHRNRWLHEVQPVKQLRYSVVFRQQG